MTWTIFRLSAAASLVVFASSQMSVAQPVDQALEPTEQAVERAAPEAPSLDADEQGFESEATGGGFPNASTTGVRRHVNLKVHNGDMTVRRDGALITGLEIRGSLRIEADRVVVKDVKIVSNGDHAILIPDRYRATIKYCDIIGGRNGISGAGTFIGNNIARNENGINVYGASVIEDNFIHDMAGGPDAHFDGIENNGASNMVLRHNTIINKYGQTAAVMMNNEFGSIKRAVIANNYLAGGGYTIYSDGRKNPSDPIEGVQIRNNRLGKGQWGYYAFMSNRPALSGNVLIGTRWKADEPAAR